MPMLDGILSIEDLELEGTRVFIRVDFNVPLDKKTRTITDDERIRAALPTIKYAVEKGAKVILASHLGRPKGKAVPELSMEPVGARLAELGGWEVHVPDDCVGDAAKKVVQDLRDGQVCLLENLRYHDEEEANDEAFAKELARRHPDWGLVREPEAVEADGVSSSCAPTPAGWSPLRGSP